MLINERQMQRILRGVLNEMYEGNDTDRDITTDELGDYLNKMQKNWIVHAGYFNTKTFPLSKAYVNSENSARLMDFISSMPEDSLFHDFMPKDSIQGMNDYVSDTNPKKNKTYNFRTNDAYEIVKFQEYSMNWMTRQDVGKFYDASSKKILDLRQKYGFGPDVDPEDSTNWRNKSHVVKSGKNAGNVEYDYGGPGLMPIKYRNGSEYNDSKGEEGFHDSWRSPKTGKYAIRQNATAYGEPLYFLFNTETKQGELIGNDLYDFLSKGFSKQSSKSVMLDLAEDEMEYRKELALLKKEESKVWTLLEDNTLFISYTAKSPSGEKVKKRWVNPDLMSEYGPIISQINLNGRVNLSESKTINESKELAEVKGFMSRLNMIK